MKNLVIVESPTKARTLSKFLGDNYLISATLGHVRDLPEKKLGIDISASGTVFEFMPHYQIISGRRNQIKLLKRQADTSTEIILATDPDREGEAIAYHIKEILKNDKDNGQKFIRIVFHEITKQAIDMAIKNPHDINLKLVDAQQTRRILDRLVGYKLSPLLWNKLGLRWLSAGRVQSVCVRLIVDREREIKAFVPQEYWLIDAELSANKKNVFLARLSEIDDKRADLKTEIQAKSVESYLKHATYTVKKKEINKVHRYPAAPFTTSTLQQTAVIKFGWSARRTMHAAQNLYEEGYITYHRTDSTNIASVAIVNARQFIQNIYGNNYLPETARFYKTKSKVAQEAHEAIRPTNIKTVMHTDSKKISDDIIKTHKVSPLPQELGRDNQLLYSLIWRRFLACQMKEALFEQTKVDIEAISTAIENQAIIIKNNCHLKAVGTLMKFNGFLIVYENEELDKMLIDKGKLPILQVNEKLNLHRILLAQKFTEPPARFNEASLIKVLEEKGIGRPSTYAPIISTIQDRKYVEKIDRKFFPTDLGFIVVDFLVAHFPDIFAISFTAKMEEKIDEVANGNVKWVQVLNDFYFPFKKKLDIVFTQTEKVKIDLGTTDQKCPKCGGQLAIKLSKYGKFLACSNFPKCTYKQNILEKIGIKCPSCGNDIVIKKTRKGKQFYGCSNYPKCTYAAWKKEDIK